MQESLLSENCCDILISTLSIRNHFRLAAWDSGRTGKNHPKPANTGPNRYVTCSGAGSGLQDFKRFTREADLHKTQPCSASPLIRRSARPPEWIKSRREPDRESRQTPHW